MKSASLFCALAGVTVALSFAGSAHGYDEQHSSQINAFELYIGATKCNALNLSFSLQDVNAISRYTVAVTKDNGFSQEEKDQLWNTAKTEVEKAPLTNTNCMTYQQWAIKLLKERNPEKSPF